MVDEPQGAPPPINPLLAPQYYATGVQLFHQSNDFSIIFMRSHPSITPTEVGKSPIMAFMQAIALIQMSPQTAKDLHVALGNQLAVYEKEWGQIETGYTRRLAGE
jgi:hypothetical protein